MRKYISCKDANKDCCWSSAADNEEELISMVKEHVLAEHTEIELNPENITCIKSLIIKKSGKFLWWGDRSFGNFVKLIENLQ
ncbi:DUF1059 domain-containing protein [Nitrosopumilus sp.]|nr:DUF1059 domain-containing protein [Nitrosopumilus sp.]|tara:strand:- start:428 stop:673 length:246 start_codon:yes stop_codon:yes gene_type:complete